MNPDIKTAWLEALRGGAYAQGTTNLRQADGDTVRYTALGLLCYLAEQDGVTEAWLLPDSLDGQRLVTYGTGRERRALGVPVSVQTWSGITPNPPVVTVEETETFIEIDENGFEIINDMQVEEERLLADLNDTGWTFADLADLIEEWL